MNQTAVEWLVDEMIQRKFFEKETELSYTTLEHLTNQAKEIERQQIIDAHGVQTKKTSGLSTYRLSGEKYYEQTFKQEL